MDEAKIGLLIYLFFEKDCFSLEAFTKYVYFTKRNFVYKPDSSRHDGFDRCKCFNTPNSSCMSRVTQFFTETLIPCYNGNIQCRWCTLHMNQSSSFHAIHVHLDNAHHQFVSRISQIKCQGNNDLHHSF